MKNVGIDTGPTQSAPQTVLSGVEERRREPRYVPVMERAYLGWWVGETFRTELGRLANISAGGAALDIATDPGVGESVWLCVIGPNRMGWVAARLLARDGNLVRMVFAERFPYELFKSVVWGFPGHDPEKLAERPATSQAAPDAFEPVAGKLSHSA